LTSFSCASLRKSEAEKVNSELQKADVQARAEVKKMEKAHYKKQPRETRKMMKRSKRMSKKLNKQRRLSD
jgi:hypothetical protein